MSNKIQTTVNKTGSLKIQIAALWDKLIDVRAKDDEERRIGRLFNTLMVVGTGIVIYLAVIFLLMKPLGFSGEIWIPWVAAAFPGAFIPLSIFCLIMARRGHVHSMVLLYCWINFIAIGVAAFVFDGIYSPAWILFMWTITIAGTLIVPAYALWMAGVAIIYFMILLILTRIGIYVPPLSFGLDGREYVNLACILVIMGTSVGLLTYLNIRTLRDALRALRESENKYRKIFENVQDIFYQTDITGNITEISPSVERYAGFKPEELIGTPVVNVYMNPDDRKWLMKAIKEKGEVIDYELKLKSKTGNLIYTSVNAHILMDSSGKPTGMEGSLRDITERKKMEERITKLNENLEIKVEEKTKELLEAQEELVRKEKLATLGLIAGNIGNELRNPLGVMNNAVYFLKTTLTGIDKNSTEYLDIIQDEILQAERILSDLLNSVHTKQPVPEVIDAGTLIKKSMEKIKIPPNIKLNIDIDPLSISVNTDILQTKEALINLMKNSVDAMPEGGNIDIRVRIDEENQKMVRFIIHDTGSGITPENMAKLFHPLFTTKSRGIGLGLVIAKNFIEINGGRIDVQSVTGKGTTFTIILPMAANERGENMI